MLVAVCKGSCEYPAAVALKCSVGVLTRVGIHVFICGSRKLARYSTVELDDSYQEAGSEHGNLAGTISGTLSLLL